MTKEEKQILKNQMAIIDMLAYMIYDQEPMTLCERPWNIRINADEMIRSTKKLICGDES